MKAYLHYSNQLDTLLNDIEWGAKLHPEKEKVIHSLNGGASQALRESVSENRIQHTGTFFTGELLARQAVSRVVKKKSLLRGPVYDPTCGAGDLLLRWAYFLPIDSNLVVTLRNWDRLIYGIDLHPEFIKVAKRRLVLLALLRGARLKQSRPPRIEELFSGLRTGDILKHNANVPAEATLLMNPPFTFTKSEDDCDWASGKVSLAAVSFMKCLGQCSKGQHIVAILPDVLRSGTRYSRWRITVEEMFHIDRMEVFGRFDSNADVDVFIIEGHVGFARKKPFRWKNISENSRRQKMKSICSIGVGAVVPHRDPKEGRWRPYIAVADLPAWERVSKINTHRRFKGSTVKLPLVAVRRTSSPSDSKRAIGTIVSSTDESAALENHVIALQPLDGKVKTCKIIMENLKDARTDRWLNKRIRCRHLTVTALRELPLWKG